MQEEPGLRAETLRAQHSEIRECIADLQAMPSGERKIRELLARLETLLRDHFELEERGGYLEEALTRAPQLSSTATRLVKEHGSLLGRIRDLHERARSTSADDLRDAAFAESVGQFAEQLHDHEIAENRLLQDAYLEDRGGGG